MFKSEEAKTGYPGLKNDYELFTSIGDKLVTRMAEKAFDDLVERFYDEVMMLFTDEFLDKAQAYMEEQGTDGNLEGFIEAVDHFTEGKL